MANRSHILVRKIDDVLKKPLSMHAAYAEELAREASMLLLELSVEAEAILRESTALRSRFEKLESSLKLVGSGLL